MKVLDRYLIDEYLGNLLLIILSLVSLFLIIDFFEKFRMFLSNHATFGQIGSYFLFRLPMMVSQMLPAAILLASLVTCGYLSRHNEITAMKANGISLYRIALPVLTIAVMTSLLIFFLSEWVTPYTNDKAENIRLVEVQKRTSMGSFKQDQIWYRGQKGIYNFRLFDARTGTLHGITIHYLDRKMNLVMRLDAERGEWTEGRWLFHNILLTRFNDGAFPVLSKMRQQIVDLPERPSDFQVVQKDVAAMGYIELKRYIRKLQTEGYDATRYIVELHGKIAFSLVSIILAVIGFSFPLRSERSGGIAQGIGAGLVIGFSYWLVYAFGMSLGRSGTLPPFIAAWFANILFVAASILLMGRVKT
ncbi:MAG: LPS export ABC transporter permease LptG [Deltaproteobacteria bacterium]|nr:LPS export ABC transporter permease LptG [Deltaproteobacteria bacterium]